MQHFVSMDASRPGAPVAIIDIGSNSVRLVAYEGLTRSPTPIYNEKVLCGLARGVMTTGRLAPDGVERALAALSRFRKLCDVMRIGDVVVIATAAARDAKNGPDFLRQAAEVIGDAPTLLSGRREAELSGLGVVAGIYKPDGVVGDLGGGSLELIDVKDARLGKGTTLPLGGLSLMDASGKSTRAALKIVRDAIVEAAPLGGLKGRDFYAVGGTWRAFARLHMRQRNYPLQMMHGYVIAARDAADFADLLARVDSDALDAITSIPAQRRPLLAYAAVVLAEIVRHAKPRDIVFSASGVREGLLFERLPPEEQTLDPLTFSAAQFNVIRSRAGPRQLDRKLLEDAFAGRSAERSQAASHVMFAGRHRLARASRLSRRASARAYRQCDGERRRSSRPRLHRARQRNPP